MPPVSVGLEVGATTVKMVELVHGRKAVKLTKLARVEIQPDLEDNDRESAVVKILKNLARDYRVNLGRVVFGVGGESVIVRRMVVPPVPEEELVQAVRWQAEEHLPYSLDEVYLDFQVLGRGRRKAESPSSLAD